MGLSSFKFVNLSATECVLAVQGPLRSPILVPIESVHATSYLSRIVTMVLSCAGSEIRRIIGKKIAYFFYPLSFGALAPRAYVPFGISR